MLKKETVHGFTPLHLFIFLIPLTNYKLLEELKPILKLLMEKSDVLQRVGQYLFKASKEDFEK